MSEPEQSSKPSGGFMRVAALSTFFGAGAGYLMQHAMWAYTHTANVGDKMVTPGITAFFIAGLAIVAKGFGDAHDKSATAVVAFLLAIAPGSAIHQAMDNWAAPQVAAPSPSRS